MATSGGFTIIRKENTMDLEYLADQIKDELCGAKDYIKKAIELKPMTESWSKKFFEMSTEEHKHAQNLFQMFDEYCSKMSNSIASMPEYATKLHIETVDIYTECTAELKAMFDIYKS